MTTTAATVSTAPDASVLEGIERETLLSAILSAHLGVAHSEDDFRALSAEAASLVERASSALADADTAFLQMAFNYGLALGHGITATEVADHFKAAKAGGYTSAAGWTYVAAVGAFAALEGDLPSDWVYRASSLDSRQSVFTRLSFVMKGNGGSGHAKALKAAGVPTGAAALDHVCNGATTEVAIKRLVALEAKQARTVAAAVEAAAQAQADAASQQADAEAATAAIVAGMKGEAQEAQEAASDATAPVVATKALEAQRDALAALLATIKGGAALAADDDLIAAEISAYASEIATLVRDAVAAA